MLSWTSKVAIPLPCLACKARVIWPSQRCDGDKISIVQSAAVEGLKEEQQQAPPAIRSTSSNRDLSVEVAIDSKVAKDKVERAMKTARAEERHRCLTCSVQNAS
ncbi:hypothetical protein GW17_00040372 [Ensete ventricosum]|nr:hypothetical protein GW17_00040372 [Ensete ventricosum]